uniref:Uncharacterized protein n=1 Tax=Rhizophora mucronata TaxID=61149 RepID=A0A2P2R2P2_RHIMU
MLKLKTPGKDHSDLCKNCTLVGFLTYFLVFLLEYCLFPILLVWQIM